MEARQIFSFEIFKNPVSQFRKYRISRDSKAIWDYPFKWLTLTSASFFLNILKHCKNVYRAVLHKKSPAAKNARKKSVLEYRRHRDTVCKSGTWAAGGSFAVTPKVSAHSLWREKCFKIHVAARKKDGAERYECVLDAQTSKASKELKLVTEVVLLHLWRVNVNTTGGFIYISLEDFHMDKTAPL